MKKYICLIIIFIGALSFVKGQQLKREYDYDNAGNRIVRKVVTITSQKSSPGHKSANSQSEAGDEEFYEDKVGDISLKIFPNPTTSVVVLQIEGKQDEVDGTVMLYDLSGAKIGEQRITSYRTEVNMSSYPTGAYLATVMINGKVSYWKIVKQ